MSYVVSHLSNAGISRRIANFRKGQIIFSQDDPCDDVLYIHHSYCHSRGPNRIRIAFLPRGSTSSDSRRVVGTTRSRVNLLMNKFTHLGFIHYNSGLQVHSGLLNVMLQD